jgi:hypothetical protein
MKYATHTPIDLESTNSMSFVYIDLESKINIFVYIDLESKNSMLFVY